MNWVRLTWHSFWSQKFCRLLLLSSLSLYIPLCITFVLLNSPYIPKQYQLPPEFPLFYSHPQGKEQLAKFNDLFIVILGLGICLLINYLLAFFLEKRWPVLCKTLLWAAVLIVGLFDYSLIRIYLLVI